MLMGEVIHLIAQKNECPQYRGPCNLIPYIYFWERRAPQLEAEARKNVEAGKVIFDGFESLLGWIAEPKEPVS